MDRQLLAAFAEIAGVFVGFGALIAVTRRGEVAPHELGQLRAVVTVGLIALVAALVPVGLDAYGVEGHALWFGSSLIFLAIIWVVIVVSLRQPEQRQLIRSQARLGPVTAALYWTLEVLTQAPLVLTVLGLFRDVEPAFYMTAVILHLAQAAFVLAQLVYAGVARNRGP
jgi:hypothetical protein